MATAVTAVPLRSPLRNKAVKAAATTGFASWFSGSKVVNPDGTPRVLYHATRRNFVQFEQQSKGRELGFHFGTLAAAQEHLSFEHTYRRSGAFKPGAHIRPVYLAIRNPLALPDPGKFTVDRLLRRFELLTVPDPKSGATGRHWPGPLLEVGVISTQQSDELLAMTKDPYDYYEERARLRLIELLEAVGYDGIVYTNTYEDKGSLSYIAFHPHQIVSALCLDCVPPRALRRPRIAR